MNLMDSKTLSWFQDRLRYFNREVLNPLTLSFAGRRYSFYGFIRHVGRRSGHLYDTPILVGEAAETYIVPLIYGQAVDWLRNVQAAGGGKLVWRGRLIQVAYPEMIGQQVGLQAFPAWLRPVMELLAQRTGHDKFLRLSPVSFESRERYRHVTAQHPLERGILSLALTGYLLVWLGKYLKGLAHRRKPS